MHRQPETNPGRQGHSLSQLPLESKKKPFAHVAQAVPFDEAVHPALQVHLPFEPHTPLAQLHVEGAFVTLNWRHVPVPEMPSSQSRQPAAQASQLGPKCPETHDSQDDPVKPLWQTHLPDEEQMPPEEHGDEHEVDCMSNSVSELPKLLEGSCETSGTEFHRTMRLLDDEPATDIQMLDARAREPAESCFVVFVDTLVGRALKVLLPE